MSAHLTDRLVRSVVSMLSTRRHVNNTYSLWSRGVVRGGGPGVPVTLPLCKPFFKQTTYNILWRKRHDDIV